jgi:hypothetical protein
MALPMITFGNDKETKKAVGVTPEDLWYSLYLIGATGMGKTNLLKDTARQFMERGEGFCFIDPAGDASEELPAYIPEHRENDLVYWNPVDEKYELGLNPFECNPESRVARSVIPQNFVFAIENLEEFQEAFTNAPHVRETLRNLGHAFVANQGRTFDETIPILDTSSQGIMFRLGFYEKLGKYNPRSLAYWQRFDKLPEKERVERVKAPLNKLSAFVDDPILESIYKKKHSFCNFRALMDEGKILIIRLADIGPRNAAFLGSLVVAGLWSAALTRTDIPEDKRRRFHLIADEFQDYLTGVFPEIQKKGRKYGLDTIIAHQDRGGMSDRMRSVTLGIKNKIIFSINSIDAAELAPEVDVKTLVTMAVQRQSMPAPVLNPLRYIQIHGPANENIARCVTQIIETTLQEVYKKEWVDYEDSRDWGITSPPSVSLSERSLDELIRQYLYARMCGKPALREEVQIANRLTEHTYTYTTLDRLYEDLESARFILAGWEALETTLQPQWRARLEELRHFFSNSDNAKKVEHLRQRILDVRTKLASGQKSLDKPLLLKPQGVKQSLQASIQRTEREIAEVTTDIGRLNYLCDCLEDTQRRLAKLEQKEKQEHAYLLKRLLLEDVVAAQKQELAELEQQFQLLYLETTKEHSKLSREIEELQEICSPQNEKVFKLRETIAMLEAFDSRMRVLIELGNELEKAPIFTDSGTYEYMSNNPQAVWAEIASDMTQAPRWTARVILMQDGVSKSYVIETTKLRKPTPEELARGEELKRISQEYYSRDREPALTITNTQQAITSEAPAPAVSVPDEKPDYDDDPDTHISGPIKPITK